MLSNILGFSKFSRIPRRQNKVFFHRLSFLVLVKICSMICEFVQLLKAFKRKMHFSCNVPHETLEAKKDTFKSNSLQPLQFSQTLGPGLNSILQVFTFPAARVNTFTSNLCIFIYLNVI